MSTGGYSLDQLMELAGLSVSQAVFKLHPAFSGARILVACGPGNNGGDGLVAARHLYHYGYKPTLYYPKPTNKDIFERLTTQLKDLDIPFTEDFEKALHETDYIVDSIFGFSFSGAVRPPFDTVISQLEQASKHDTRRGYH